QWILVSIQFWGLARLLPLYVSEWVLPGVVATFVANEKLSGRWQMATITRISNFDLWLSSVIAPALPWLFVAILLWAPFLLGPEGNADGVFPFVANRTAVSGHLALLEALIYLVGILASSLLYSGLAVVCAFRARAPRAAAVQTYIVN